MSQVHGLSDPGSIDPNVPLHSIEADTTSPVGPCDYGEALLGVPPLIANNQLGGVDRGYEGLDGMGYSIPNSVKGNLI